MLRILVFFSGLLIIGTVCSDEYSILVYNIEATENKAINEVKKKYIEFVAEINKLLDELGTQYRHKINGAIENYRKPLLFASGFFENALENLIHVNIYKESCGIVGIRDNVMDAYDSGHACFTEIVDNYEKETRDVVQETFEMSKYFEIIEKNVRACRKLETDVEKIVECLVAESKNAEEQMKLLHKITSYIREIVQPHVLMKVLSRCLTDKITKTFQTKVNQTITCICSKIPGSMEIVNLIKENAKKAEHRLNYAINIFKAIIIEILEYFDDKFIPLESHIDALATEIKESTTEFFDNMKNVLSQNLKQLWDKFIG